MTKENQRTELNNLGEFGLIRRIREQFPVQQPSTILGIGDDAAILSPEAGNQQVVSTDLLLEGIHFDLSFHPLPHLGFKAVAVNISDIAAMNAIPKQITVSIGLSNRFSLEAVDALMEGIKAACEAYNVDLVGGDTTASASGLVISITAIGEAKPEQISRRSGAMVNDIVCCTGDLGGAYMGLQVLLREKEVFKSNPDMQPDLAKYEYVVGRQLRPNARMDVIHDLRDLGVVPTAMMDVSDGLASELLHISHESNLGVVIYEKNLPFTEEMNQTAAEFNISPITCLLNGGEDYELVFTISQEDHEKIKNHPDIHLIGYMAEPDKGKLMVTKAETVIPLKAQGWDHFS